MERLNWEKFEALVHYVCQKAVDPSVLGSVKLNKVLWYSDSVFYAMHGRSITGETYVKRQHGPVPKHVLRAVDNLVRNRKVARGRADHFGFYKTEFVAIEDADVGMFTAAEIAHVDDAFQHVCVSHTARSVSEETHNVIWKAAQMGEEIPLSTVFALDIGEVDETDLEWYEKFKGKAAA